MKEGMDKSNNKTENTALFQEVERQLAILEETAPWLHRALLEYFTILKPNLLARNPQSHDRIERGMLWAKGFLAWKLMSRIRRADDLEAVDEEANNIVDQARELAKNFIGEHTYHYFVTCIDGRQMPVIMLSHVPHFGGALRTQAGELFDFEPSFVDDSVIIDLNSHEAQAIIKLLRDKPGETIYYSLDSHLGCAARGNHATAEGLICNDDGLLSDIQRKMRIAKGIKQIAEILRANGENIAEIIPQSFSFDPHDGTFYFGLECHLDEAEHNQGFNAELINKLTAENKIVNTWKFINDPEIQAELAAVVQPADFRDHFPDSLLNNWRAITALYNSGHGMVYQRIVSALEFAYQNSNYALGNHDDMLTRQISYRTIRMKAKIMLKNLVTRWSIAQDSKDWPFDSHLEQSVVVTQHGYAPFSSGEGEPHPDSFAVFSKEDLPLLLDHVKLAVAGLVRKLRANGKTRDPLKSLEGQQFTEAPIVVMNHGIIRNMSAETWQLLQEINFSAIFATIPWDQTEVVKTWTATDIRELLVLHLPSLTMEMQEFQLLIDTLFDLFEKVRYMLSDTEMRSWVVSGRVLLINKLVDRNRRPMVLVPMVF